MIVSGLLTLVTALVNLIPFELPALSVDLATALPTALAYITAGLGFLKAMLGPTALTVMSGMVAILEGCHIAYITYTFSFWIIRKIPMLNIRE